MRRSALDLEEYNRNVFVNCPFDPKYQKLLRAILFSILDCGFQPRCALEDIDSGTPRIQKIERLIAESKFGIHDLSRIELDLHSGLPRFNMPFELGLFLGAKRFGIMPHKSKTCLILDSEKYRYQKFLSDLGGQDIEEHGNDVGRIIRCVRDWLAPHASHKSLQPGGAHIEKRHYQFLSDLPDLCRSFKFEQDERLTHLDLLKAMKLWIEASPS